MDPNSNSMNSSDFNVDDFMASLASNTPTYEARGENAVRLQKIHMHAPPNNGRITFVPFPSKQGFQVFLNWANGEDGRVKELKFNSGILDDESWHKILPKKYYGTLSVEDDALFGEVVSMFKNVQDLDVLDWQKIRIKNYSLMYGYVLSHYNVQNQKVEDTKPGASLIIIPTKDLPQKLQENIQYTNQKFNGHPWIQQVYSKVGSPRTGYITIGFSRKDSPGYDLSVEHGVNIPPMVVVVPQNFAASDEEVTLMTGDIIADFLGWQKAEDGSFFRRELFISMRNYLKAIIDLHRPVEVQIEAGMIGVSAGGVPTGNNNAAIDPMLQAAMVQSHIVQQQVGYPPQQFNPSQQQQAPLGYPPQQFDPSQQPQYAPQQPAVYPQQQIPVNYPPQVVPESGHITPNFPSPPPMVAPQV